MSKYEEIKGYSLDEMAEFLFNLIRQTAIEGPPCSLTPETGTLIVKQALQTKVI